MNNFANHFLSKNKKYESIRYILLNALILLFIAQFDKLYFGTNYSLMILPLIIGFMIFKQYIAKSIFLFILLIFIGSHFTFLNESGGTFAIAAFFVILINLLQKKNVREIKIKDNKINFLVFILLLFSVSGWLLKSKLTMIELLFSAITFFSIILMFNISSRIVWTEARMLDFIVILCVIIIYALFTAIANTIHLIPIKSTLWYSFEMNYIGEGSFFISMIKRPSTAVGAMYFSFLVPFFILKSKMIITNLNKKILLAGIISSSLVCVVGFSKSHLVVFGFAITIIPLIILFQLKSNYSLFKNYFILIALGIVCFILFKPFFHFETYQTRFAEQPDLFKNFMANPLKPMNTTREESFTLGQESLERENWFIGYGYSNGTLNRIAWFGDDYDKTNKYDFHSTYYSLPQLFGWLGALAYLSLFIITMRRMYKIFKNKNVIGYYRIFSFSFCMLFLIHLMTEYSITALTAPHYLMMLFILLGFANSLFSNYRRGMLFIKHDKKY